MINTQVKGKITQIIGPVIDAQFPEGALPEIYDAIEIYDEKGNKTTAEVQQLLGENTVRSVAMSSTDGLKRGMDFINTSNTNKMPEGNGILGRILNVLGEPVDEMGEVHADDYFPIQSRNAGLTEQNTQIEILETELR
jgi:F-type H+-transporting ATPase subunit beta